MQRSSPFQFVPLAACLLLGSVKAGVCQTAPPLTGPTNPVLPPVQDIQPPTSTPTPEPPSLLPPPDQLLPLPEPATPAQPIPGEVPDTIVVERFEVVGSTVFTAADFAEVTARFTKRPISLTELFQARTAVTQLYLDRGYITSGAFIPPQKLQGGVVTIQVIEGRLEDIQVSGTTRLDPGYIRSRLAIATAPPLHRDRLLEALQLLQLNPLIQTLAAELSAGTTPGTNLLQVKVTEAPTFQAQLLFDNDRSPSVGTDRRQIQLSEGNLLGFGDSIGLTYTNTDGSNALDASYTLPLSPYNTTLTLAYGTTSSQVIERPFNVLDITSASRYYELTLRQPLIQTPSQELALGLIAARRESEALLLGGALPFPAPGSDAQGRTRISALRFFQDYTSRSSTDVIALRSQLSFGLGLLDATINANPPDTRFVAWRGQGQYVRLLAPDLLLLVRGDLQFADRPLVALEQFSLGGLETVRGYRRDLLVADNGFLASVGLRIPVLRIPEINSLVQVEPFVDVGTVWNQSGGSTLTTTTLASTGLGLRWQVVDRLTARFVWGIPLVSVPRSSNTWQENGLYFSIVYTPF